MSKKQPPLLTQMISVSGKLNRGEKLALVKYLMIELDEPLYTTADVKAIVNGAIRQQSNNIEVMRQQIGRLAR